MTKMKQEPFDRSKHVYHNEAFVELVSLPTLDDPIAL